ncbi:MAG: DUF488 domain-containing protein [Gammaproteobacteria bacterium]|nr:DUF488 domain-containing protein [Gammaproteobacteria bacterium]
MKTYTIGFTRKGAADFFQLLQNNGVKRMLDVRLNNISQLAGFTKRDDLRFFLHELCNIEYHHLEELAPTKEILNPYKNRQMSWAEYEDRFINLMVSRSVEKSVRSELLDGGCLLCSEHQPHHCHRRLVADYLNQTLNLEMEVIHLL